MGRRGEGSFFVLEGPDGSGKSTQAARLVAWLEKAGPTPLHLRDPGGTPIGERIRGILLDPGNRELDPRAEALLFMASRAQLVAERIRPALGDGRIVVVERWLLSTVCYQGYAGGLDVEEIWRMGSTATGGLEPDLTLVLDVDPEVGLARLPGERDLLEGRPAAYHEKVREGYLEIVRECRMNACLVPAGTIEETASRIRERVRDVLGGRHGLS